MSLEDRKHLALIVRLQVKKTVLGQNPAVALIELQFTHIGYTPIVLREMLFADRNERRGRIDAGDPVSSVNKVLRHWFCGTTTNIENAPISIRHRQTKTIPSLSMTLVEIDDVIGMLLRE